MSGAHPDLARAWQADEGPLNGTYSNAETNGTASGDIGLPDTETTIGEEKHTPPWGSP